MHDDDSPMNLQSRVRLRLQRRIPRGPRRSVSVGVEMCTLGTCRLLTLWLESAFVDGMQDLSSQYTISRMVQDRL